MKIEIKGTITDRMSQKVTGNNGTKIYAKVIVKEGERNGNDIVKIFETSKEELINRITQMPAGTKVQCTGYLNCFSGTGNNGKKYAITKINLTEIELQENHNYNNQNSYQQQQTNNQQIQNSGVGDLPF